MQGSEATDSSWHGTRVAGILGAITDNATGIAGLTWNGGILPVRVLGKCGGFDSDIMEGMLWAAGLHVAGIPDNPYPAKIVNLSLGSAGACPRSYRDVISRLTTAGVLVVVSVGNEGGPVDAPANCSGVAAVAGLRHAGTKVGYSSLGPEVALSAPAGNCVSSTGACLYPIDTTYNTGTTTPGVNSYTDQLNYNIGTSFSSPIVAGIAALMKSVNGNLNSPQLIARLKEGTTAFPVDGNVPTCHVPADANDVQDLECNCTTQTCGAGMANASKAVAAALRPIAIIVAPTSIAPGQNVVLQGGGSTAANLHNISAYSWSIIGGGSSPPGISGANTATATVTAPTSGSYTVRLTVTDDAGRQDTADVVVRPTASSGGGGGGAIDVLTLLAGLFLTAVRMTRRALLAIAWDVSKIQGSPDTAATSGEVRQDARHRRAGDGLEFQTQRAPRPHMPRTRDGAITQRSFRRVRHQIHVLVMQGDTVHAGGLLTGESAAVSLAIRAAGDVVEHQPRNVVVVNRCQLFHLAVLNDHDAVVIETVLPVVEIAQLLVGIGTELQGRNMIADQDDQTVLVDLHQIVDILGDGLGAVKELVRFALQLRILVSGPTASAPADVSGHWSRAAYDHRSPADS